MRVSKANNDPYIPQDEAKKARRNVRIYSRFCHTVTLPTRSLDLV